MTLSILIVGAVTVVWVWRRWLAHEEQQVVSERWFQERIRERRDG